jgi:ribosomal protein S25
MDENIEIRILEFVQNRHKIDESTAPRHIHIRFDLEMSRAENVLETLTQKNKILKFYDKDYQENRYLPAL